jgi:hypothetical protein
MATEEELKSREKGVSDVVRAVPNVRVSASPPWDAVVQGYLGLSDRRVSASLRTARPGKFLRSTPGLAGALSSVVFREKGGGEVFPWEVIDGGLRRVALRARYEAFFP